MDPLSSDYEDEENQANLPLSGGGEPSVQQHLQMAKHNSEVASLQQALQSARAELSERKAKSADVKRHARSKLEEAARSFATRLNSLEAELRATQERARVAGRAKATSAKELEANLAQTISLYSVIQQHQATIEQQRVRCEQSDAQYASVASKLKGAEKEMQRLRLLLDKEHDSNERHISALKGQLAIKSDEVLAKDTRLRTLEEEYAAHRAEYEARISSLEKDRSILEAVNFELRAEREKNHHLEQENADMKQTVLKKAHLEGQYAAQLEQNLTLSKTVSRLEDERAQWVAERRELDHQLGERVAQVKQLTIERDALQIDLRSKEQQLVENVNEGARRLAALTEAKETKEALLQSQLVERDALISRAQNTIDQLQKEGGEERVAKKNLLDTIEQLEASVRDLQRELAERNDALEATQTQLADVQAQLDALQSAASSSASNFEAEQARHKRTRGSRYALVEKLDQGYNGSYLAQIFTKWKHEWRVREKERAVQAVHNEKEQLHQQHSQTQARVESSVEALRAMENAMQAEREEAAEAARRAQKQWEAEQQRLLEQCKTDWEREQLLAREAERREKLEREARIAEERQKVREEVEEARRLELAAFHARGGLEAAQASSSHSIARRPSVKDLVTTTVKEALRQHSPEKRASPAASSHAARERSVADDRSRRSSLSRSPELGPRSKSASRRTTAEAPLNISHHLQAPSASSVAGTARTAKSASPSTKSSPKLAPASPPEMSQQPPQQQHSYMQQVPMQPLAHQMGAPAFLYDPIAAAAAAAAAGAEAAFAADRRARSLSREHRRRHHHHHHHHRSSERDGGSPYDGRSRRHSASPPPTMPPLTQQPFQLPANFAQYIQSMQAQQQQQQQQEQHQPPAAAAPSQAASQRSVASRPAAPAAAGRSKARSSLTSAQTAAAASKPSAARTSSSSSAAAASNKSIARAAAAVVAAASAAPTLSRKTSSASSSTIDSVRDSVLSAINASSAVAPSAPASRSLYTVIPPLPLHRVKGLRESAEEMTLAAGSPLDTMGSPSPSPPAPGAQQHQQQQQQFGGDEHDVERARLAEGLGHFLSLQPAVEPETAHATAAAAPTHARRGSGSSVRSSTSNKPPVVAAVTAAKKRAQK